MSKQPLTSSFFSVTSNSYEEFVLFEVFNDTIKYNSVECYNCIRNDLRYNETRCGFFLRRLDNFVTLNLERLPSGNMVNNC